MLTCYRTRRRIGAYLDGALDEGAARAAAAHLEACARCRQEAEGLRRLRLTLQQALTVPAPDWTGFWPGVVRGIQDGRQPAPRRLASRRWGLPTWALGGALAAALLVSLTLPQLWPTGSPAEAPVIVSSAITEYPRGSVMVYSTPERDVTVVWVFGLE